MELPKENYFTATPEQITDFLVKLYEGTVEGNILKQLKEKGKKVLEFPIDFEPYHLSKMIPLEILVKRFEGFDYIILYHGSSSILRKEIEKNGLQPRTETGVSSFGNEKESLPNSVYLGQLDYFGNIFDSVKTHAYESMKRKGGKPIICRVIIPIKKLLEDEDVNNATNGIASVALGGVSRIEGSIKEGIIIYEFPQVNYQFDIQMHSFKYLQFNKNK